MMSAQKTCVICGGKIEWSDPSTTTSKGEVHLPHWKEQVMVAKSEQVRPILEVLFDALDEELKSVINYKRRACRSAGFGGDILERINSIGFDELRHVSDLTRAIENVQNKTESGQSSAIG